MKTTSCRSKDTLDTSRIRFVLDSRVKPKKAAEAASRVATWVATGCGLEQEPDERALFEALHACGYRAASTGRRARAATVERNVWAGRWKLIRDYLVEQNLGLAYATLSRFHAHHSDWDDLRSEAHLALVRAVEGFNPWRGFRLSTYACHAIVRALIHSTRKSNRYRLQFPMELDVWDERPVQKDASLELSVDRLRLVLSENRGELTDRESNILAQRFPMNGGLRLTLEELGEIYGLSKERVRQIQNEALSKLRHVLEADPILQ